MGKSSQFVPGKLVATHRPTFASLSGPKAACKPPAQQYASTASVIGNNSATLFGNGKTPRPKTPLDCTRCHLMTVSHLDDGQRGSPVGIETGEQDAEDSIAVPQLGAFDGVLVDGNLLRQCKDLSGLVESGCEKRSDQEIDCLDNVLGEVSQSCQEHGDSTPAKPGHQIP
jgi:hypothetical protein